MKKYLKAPPPACACRHKLGAKKHRPGSLAITKDAAIARPQSRRPHTKETRVNPAPTGVTATNRGSIIPNRENRHFLQNFLSRHYTEEYSRQVAKAKERKLERRARAQQKKSRNKFSSK